MNWFETFALKPSQSWCLGGCVKKCNLYLTRQVSYEQILIYNDCLPRTTLGQLCAALWYSQSRSVMIVWNLTRVCSDASSTEIQCLRLMHHSGAHRIMFFVILQWNDRSFIANGQEFNKYVIDLEINPDVICVQETLLRPHLDFIIVQSDLIYQLDRMAGVLRT